MSKPKHTFFCEDINFGVLNEEESHHAARVLRLNQGDTIRIVNGKGRSAIAKITSLDKREVGFEIIEEIDRNEHPIPLHIAIAPTKSIDRFTFFLEKATEIGIREITPIQTKNSERKALKIDKLRKGMISALKQSGNLFLPRLNEFITLDSFLRQEHHEDNKLMAHCEEDEEKIQLKNVVNPEEKFLILIGPEGDFNAEEIKLAQENGFRNISLGNARFRTETAGILACHTVYLFS